MLSADERLRTRSRSPATKVAGCVFSCIPCSHSHSLVHREVKCSLSLAAPAALAAAALADGADGTEWSSDPAPAAPGPGVRTSGVGGGGAREQARRETRGSAHPAAGSQLEAAAAAAQLLARG